MNENESNLRTRKQVIDAWKKGSRKYLDYYVCPNCCNILQKEDDNIYKCTNEGCYNYGREMSQIKDNKQ